MSATVERLTIACADVGSVKSGKFGWALRDPLRSPDRMQESPENASISEFAEEIAGRIGEDRSVALGFECPLFIPVRDDPEDLTNAREGEGSRPWSAGAGSGSLVTGLAETVWMFSQIRDHLGSEPPVTFDWEEFQDTNGALLLWEAFVSGDSKVGSHSGDAGAAVKSFHDGLSSADEFPGDIDLIDEKDVFSLVGASLLRAGWDVGRDILSEPVFVVAA
jgi:hypothetical protein